MPGTVRDTERILLHKLGTQLAEIGFSGAVNVVSLRKREFLHSHAAWLRTLLCAGLLFWQSGGPHTFLFVLIYWFWYSLDSLSIVGLHFRDRVLIFQEFFRSLKVPTSWMGKLLCTKIYGGLKSSVALWSSAKGGQTSLCMGDWSERCLLWGRGNLSSLDTWQTSMSVSTLSCSLQPLLSFQGTSPRALMKSAYRKTLAGFVVVEYSVVCFCFLSCHIANFAPMFLGILVWCHFGWFSVSFQLKRLVVDVCKGPPRYRPYTGQHFTECLIEASRSSSSEHYCCEELVD